MLDSWLLQWCKIMLQFRLYFKDGDLDNKARHYDLLLISVDSPIMLGIYRDKNLLQSFAKDGKFSDTLPNLFSEIFRDMGEDFDIYYANGPGNFSAIKLTHIFLQSLVIARNNVNQKHKIRLFCADSFHFSKSEFINAYSKIHFCKKDGEIHTTTLESKWQNSFALPQKLDLQIFSDKCEPLYILPAV